MAIEAVENGSVIRISLVNLLAFPYQILDFMRHGEMKDPPIQSSGKVATITFQHHTEFHSELMPGQWQDINLTLKGVSPNT